jgi:hypothetical protein
MRGEADMRAAILRVHVVWPKKAPQENASSGAPQKQ